MLSEANKVAQFRYSSLNPAAISAREEIGVSQRSPVRKGERQREPDRASVSQRGPARTAA